MYSLVTRWEPDKVTVFTRKRPGDREVDRKLAFEVIRDPARFLFHTERVTKDVLDLVHDRNIDVVHFASVLPLALIGPRLKEAGIPYAVTVNGSEFTMPAGLPGGRALLTRALAPAAAILPYAPFLERHARRLLPEHQGIRAVSPGVDLERFGDAARPFFQSPSGGPVVLYLGRLIPRKGALALVQAFPEVLRSVPDAHLLICGDGPDRTRIENLSRQSGLGDSMTMTGGVPWQRVPGYMKSATVFAQPVRERFGGRETEGFGIVFLEAAASGLPTVGGNVGGIRDAVSDGETGILVDGKSQDQIAEALIRLLTDPSLAEKMGSAGRARVEERFTWSRFYEDFRSALEGAVGS